ncbi:hypothetical protein [Oscillatoria salina]|uniref:hypothetical protein n=1 Tax=Oscillatoria salina TaxID=331517 RepID=UPI0013B66471|nr:hypothetical protein [Oscillatoria salina]MBZ8182019.1 hypothetical protein [Oscillatoria salina IIICB1]NET87348.1 hypothetical protein [Kamptonema sp. SIO1D9]
MTIITLEDIAQYRSQLSDLTEAKSALEAIADCEGDLEDAAISLAIQVGQQPDTSDYLDGLAKRCRVALCQDVFKEDLQNNQIAAAVKYLIQGKICPSILATPVVIYAVKQGVNKFCEPLNYQVKSNDN